MGTYIADNGEIIRGGQEDDGFELNPETPIFNPPKGLHNIGDGKTIDYATPTGDKIRNENAIEENDLGKICESTDITPIPPRDKTGTIWSSFPE